MRISILPPVKARKTKNDAHLGVAFVSSVVLHAVFCALVSPVLLKMNLPVYNVKTSYVGSFSFRHTASLLSAQNWREGAPIVFFEYISKKGGLDNLSLFKKGAEVTLALSMVQRLSIESEEVKNSFERLPSDAFSVPRFSGEDILPATPSSMPAFLFRGIFSLFPNKKVLLFIPRYRPYNAYQSLLINHIARDMYIGIVPNSRCKTDQTTLEKEKISRKR